MSSSRVQTTFTGAFTSFETCTASHAKRILLTHGYSDALTRYFNEKGVEASALKTSYGEED